MEKFRDRKFALLLYPDDSTHISALEVIKKSYDYAMILHDQDTDENGEVKKPHYHVLITTGSNAKWSTSIAKELGIADNYLEKVRNLDRALEYLIHLNDDNKYQYSVNMVEGTLKNRLVATMSVSNKTEGEKVLEMIQSIEDCHRTSVTEFSKYCALNGCWDVYRRSGSIFNRIIDEHNAMVAEKEYKARQKELGWIEGYSRHTGEIYKTPFDKGYEADQVELAEIYKKYVDKM